ncbi:hypothetical protein QBC32DRAFT_31578 [Pseudoneurospora amorphoporcata]|uniref:Uncharacterized protein n=1 Tax=Pseudoneurospora amorphoporcata TaxID=241081 RepID=A0AAN6NRE9_9PEZI|nr:hypothetical protein QBC32DRAFT_31578 [Pseudoneurospora amorphoporcata]
MAILLDFFATDRHSCVEGLQRKSYSALHADHASHCLRFQRVSSVRRDRYSYHIMRRRSQWSNPEILTDPDRTHAPYSAPGWVHRRGNLSGGPVRFVISPSGCSGSVEVVSLPFPELFLSQVRATHLRTTKKTWQFGHRMCWRIGSTSVMILASGNSPRSTTWFTGSQTVRQSDKEPRAKTQSHEPRSVVSNSSRTDHLFTNRLTHSSHTSEFQSPSVPVCIHRPVPLPDFSYVRHRGTPPEEPQTHDKRHKPTKTNVTRSRISIRWVTQKKESGRMHVVTCVAWFECRDGVGTTGDETRGLFSKWRGFDTRREGSWSER